MRNMAQLMRERAEGQRLLAEEKAEHGKVFRYEPVTNGTLQAV